MHIINMYPNIYTIRKISATVYEIFNKRKTGSSEMSVVSSLNFDCIFKGLLLKKLKMVPMFCRLMTPIGAIWPLDQRTVIIR